MTREELDNATDELLDDGAPAGSITPSQDAALRKLGYDYTDQEVEGVLQNNLLPSTTKAPTVDAVLAGLESVSDDVQAQIDAGIAGVYRDAGNWDASVGTFPTTTNLGDAIEAGDLFTVEVAGTLGGVSYVAGESFRALVNTPGQTTSNWKKLVYVSGAATNTIPGLVTIASDSDVSTGTGNGMVNSTQLQEKLDNFNPTVNLGYTEYVAYITQSGTTGLSAAVRKNDTGKTISYNPTVSNPGRYAISVPGLDMTKTDIQFSPRSYSGKEFEWDFYTSGTTITLRTKNRATGAFENDLIPGNMLTIRIFP